MMSRYFCYAVLLGSLMLSGCKDLRPPQPPAAGVVHREWLSLPALPLLQGAVIALAPKLEDGLTEELMNQICGLARGNASQDQVNAFLARQKIDSAALAKGNPALSLLVNGDHVGQATTCASHLASSVFSLADLQPLATPENNAHRSAMAARAPDTAVDEDSMTTLLSVRLAVARANADVFALIASEMQRRPGLNLLEVREQAQQLFSRLAPAYLVRIRAQFPAPGTTIDLQHLDRGLLVFTSSDGAEYILRHGQLSLRQSGSMVYGDGRLHGLSRTLRVAYFDAQSGALLAPPGAVGID